MKFDCWGTITKPKLNGTFFLGSLLAGASCTLKTPQGRTTIDKTRRPLHQKTGETSKKTWRSYDRNTALPKNKQQNQRQKQATKVDREKENLTDARFEKPNPCCACTHRICCIRIPDRHIERAPSRYSSDCIATVPPLPNYKNTYCTLQCPSLHSTSLKFPISLFHQALPPPSPNLVKEAASVHCRPQ